jgi:glycerophosphoryl diester phosphodiesterase
MLVIAHRGASGHAPENTLAAFRQARDMGARAVEFDVHQTLDGELVIAHDDDLKRCAGDTRRLKNVRWAGDASRVDVGSWFNIKFSSERLPRLSDVQRTLPLPTELHLEIKHGSSVYRGIEEKIITALYATGDTGRTLISSFDHEALIRVRALDEAVRLGYLLGATTMKTALREMKKLSATSLNLSLRQTTPRIVQSAKEAGYRVYVYTVNTPKERDQLAAMGVDGIFTNYPELDLWR